MEKPTSTAIRVACPSEILIPGKELTSVDWFRDRLAIWATHNLRDFPWRRTTDPYSIFIAEFLLQRTGAATVAPIYQSFIKRYPNLASLAATPLEDVASLLQPLGLRFRASRLCETVRVLMEQYSGQIPDRETDLLKLPGVGLYTARSICSNAFSQPAAVLDTNVARILERFFGLQGNRVKSRCKLLWKVAEQVAPRRNTNRWNLTLLDFGALVCTATKPRCTNCPLRECCHYLNQHEDPNRPLR